MALHEITVYWILIPKILITNNLTKKKKDLKSNYMIEIFGKIKTFFKNNC